MADVIDFRRLLIAVEVAILAASVVFAGLVSLKLATPLLLLAATFLLGVGGAVDFARLGGDDTDAGAQAGS